ncbi:hypothetical protein ACWCV5_30505 [Streptomyces tubercidicus]
MPEETERTDLYWYRRYGGAVHFVEFLSHAQRQDLNEASPIPVERFHRLLTASTGPISRTVEEVVAQVREVLSLPDTHPAFLPIVKRISGHQNTDAVRSMLENCISALEENSRPSSELLLPPTSRQIQDLYPLLYQFNGHLEASYCDAIDSSDEAIENWLNEVHPSCRWKVPRLVSEVHMALAAYPTEEMLRYVFEEIEQSAMGDHPSWTDWFTHLASRLTEHMREHHTDKGELSKC